MGGAHELAMASVALDFEYSGHGPYPERHRIGAGLANRAAEEGTVTEDQRLHTRRSTITTALTAAVP